MRRYFDGGLAVVLGFCRKIAFKFFALSEDRYARLVTTKPFRIYAAGDFLICCCVGFFAGREVGVPSFFFVLFCYPAIRVLFAIFRRLQWNWFC